MHSGRRRAIPERHSLRWHSAPLARCAWAATNIFAAAVCPTTFDNQLREPQTQPRSHRSINSDGQTSGVTDAVTWTAQLHNRAPSLVRLAQQRAASSPDVATRAAPGGKSGTPLEDFPPRNGPATHARSNRIQSIPAAGRDGRSEEWADGSCAGQQWGQCLCCS